MEIFIRFYACGVDRIFFFFSLYRGKFEKYTYIYIYGKQNSKRVLFHYVDFEILRFKHLRMCMVDRVEDRRGILEKRLAQLGM